jgi:hypothetical protein
MGLFESTSDPQGGDHTGRRRGRATRLSLLEESAGCGFGAGGAALGAILKF